MKRPKFNPDCVRADSFDHSVTSVRRLETHMSWIFLTGATAYKVKKPVRLQFADFSQLKLRKHYCKLELQLNKHMAPAIYHSVIPIGGSAEQPKFGASPAFEYAVVMTEFPQDAVLLWKIENNELTLRECHDLGVVIAGLHNNADRAPLDSPYGKVATVAGPIFDNYRSLNAAALPPALARRVRRNLKIDVQLLRKLRATISRRKRSGTVRDCHGDLHLGNIISLNGEILAFDRLEFDPALRWIDTCNDVAFAFMELVYHGRQDLASEFLNTYLDRSGDYSSLQVLNLYARYRATIRAKICALTIAENHSHNASKVRGYLRSTEKLAPAPNAGIVLMHGLSCSGKSVSSDEIKRHFPAIRLRADVERKRAAHIDRTNNTNEAVGAGIYSADRTKLTYQRLCQLTGEIIQAGFNVVVDATFILAWQRQMFFELGRELQTGVVIVDCRAPVELLRQRLRNRADKNEEVSDATADVLQWQLQQRQPFSAAEQANTITIDSTGPIDTDQLTGKLHRLLSAN